MQSLNEQINRMIELFGSKHGVIKPLLEQKESDEKVLEKQINFASGKWSASAGNINGILDPQMAEIKKFLEENGASAKIVTIILEASESQVTNYNAEVNPKKKLNPGDLSKLRYSTIETYMKSKLSEWQQLGLVPTDPSPKIEKVEPKIQGPAWNPPAGASPEQIKKLANSKQYTDYQYLKMFIKVTSINNEPLPLNEITQTKTNRESISTTPGNPPFFYSYSIPAATIMGVDYTTLPSQLLTMNKYFANQTSLTLNNGNIIVPKVTITIKPDSNQTVNLLVNSGGSLNKEWQARISNTYQLIIPFKQGSKEWTGAWLFACFYLTGASQLDDWSRISNKPEGIDWRFITGIKRQNPGGTQSPQGQIQYFANGGPFAKKMVENGEIEENEVNLPFETIYKKIVNNYYTVE